MERRKNQRCDTWWMDEEEEEWDEGLTKLSLGECHDEWDVCTVSVQVSLHSFINNMTFLNMVIAHVKRQDSRGYVRAVEIFCSVDRSITRLWLVEFNSFAGVTFFCLIYCVECILSMFVVNNTSWNQLTYTSWNYII